MIKSIISFIFIGASIALFIMYVQPTYDEILVNKTKIARFDKALKTMQLTQKSTNNILSKYNASFTKNDIGRLQKMLPDNVNNVRLVLDIDSMASKYGGQIKNVQIQTQKTESKDTQSGTILATETAQELPYKSLTLQFDVVATYSNFLLLLRDMESSLRIVDIIKLDVRPITSNAISSDGNNISIDTQYYTFSVALRTYWLQ